MLVPPFHLWVGFNSSSCPVASIQLGDQLILFILRDKVKDDLQSWYRCHPVPDIKTCSCFVRTKKGYKKKRGTDDGNIFRNRQCRKATHRLKSQRVSMRLLQPWRTNLRSALSGSYVKRSLLTRRCEDKKIRISRPFGPLLLVIADNRVNQVLNPDTVFAKGGVEVSSDDCKRRKCETSKQRNLVCSWVDIVNNGVRIQFVMRWKTQMSSHKSIKK